MTLATILHVHFQHFDQTGLFRPQLVERHHASQATVASPSMNPPHLGPKMIALGMNIGYIPFGRTFQIENKQKKNKKRQLFILSPGALGDQKTREIFFLCFFSCNFFYHFYENDGFGKKIRIVLKSARDAE